MSAASKVTRMKLQGEASKFLNNFEITDVGLHYCHRIDNLKNEYSKYLYRFFNILNIIRDKVTKVSTRKKNSFCTK